MSFINRLLGRNKKSALFSENDLVKANACPNCWGKEEYDGQFKQYVKDATKSNINHDKSNQKAFIQQFVETHVSGIRLKTEGDQLVCKRCQKVY